MRPGLTVVVVGCLAAGACSPAPLTEARSFQVVSWLTTAEQPPLPPPTRRLDFTLRLDPIARTMILGNPQGAQQVAMQSDDGVTFRALDLVIVYADVVGGSAQGSYSRFQVTVDGDRLTGNGSGSVLTIKGDAGQSRSVTMEAVGMIDREGPSLAVPGTGADPLSGLRLIASEPLPPTATARLVGDDGQTVDLVPMPVPMSDAIFAFNKPATTLRYQTRYQVVIDPWTDLAGNPGHGNTQFVTSWQPPLVPEDGFESVGALPMGGGVAVNHQFPAISGARSALVGGSSVAGWVPSFGLTESLRVRLAVAPGDRIVRFALRPIGTQAATVFTDGAFIRVGAPGGGQVVTAELPSSVDLTTPFTVAGRPQPLFLGDSRTIEVALPDGTKDEVVFDMRLDGDPIAFTPVRSALVYLVDDLRVE